MSHAHKIFKSNISFEDVQMMLLSFFEIPSDIRFSKLPLICTAMANGPNSKLYSNSKIFFSFTPIVLCFLTVEDKDKYFLWFLGQFHTCLSNSRNVESRNLFGHSVLNQKQKLHKTHHVGLSKLKLQCQQVFAMLKCSIMISNDQQGLSECWKCSPNARQCLLRKKAQEAYISLQ